MPKKMTVSEMLKKRDPILPIPQVRQCQYCGKKYRPSYAKSKYCIKCKDKAKTDAFCILA